MTDRYANNVEAGRRSAARMDTFVDTSFGFAVTLLVISGGSMPTSAAQLSNALLHIPAFLMSFAVIVRMWLSHRSWSARYGLYDPTSTFLSLLLVAMVLIFIFPLHAMFEAFAYVVTGGVLPSRFGIASIADVRVMYTAFGAMFVAFGLVLSAMHFRAWEMRDAGGYSIEEAQDAAGFAVGYGFMALVGVTSIVLTVNLIQPGATGLSFAVPPSVYFLLSFLGLFARSVSRLFRRTA